jgi:uncharacterized protein (DUF362 family)
MLAGAGVAVAGATAYGIARYARPRPSPEPKCPVFIARNQSYSGPLARTIRDGLQAVGFDHQWVRGRQVLLKPNLVEPSPDMPHMTTHAAIVLAAVEVFSGWGATVFVGEGSAHVRDSDMILEDAGFGDALRAEKVKFTDLNYSFTVPVANAAKTSWLTEFHIPEIVAQADLIVSLPKLKAHHWVGMTASMKNLYGALPGLVYGWPKNILHQAGISKTIVDINASLPPRIGIVDGILCMEGDGPLAGTPKPMGLVAVSLNPTALDATLARVTGFDPQNMPYLQLSADRLGPIDDESIEQRGERWQELVSPFEVVDQPHLKRMLAPDRTS